MLAVAVVVAVGTGACRGGDGYDPNWPPTQASVEGTTIPFRRLTGARASERKPAGRVEAVVTRTADQLATAWASLRGGRPGSPPTAVDFSKERAVLVLAASPAVTLRTTRVVRLPGGRRDPARLVVEVTLEYWGKNCVHTAMVTQPWELVVVAAGPETTAEARVTGRTRPSC